MSVKRPRVAATSNTRYELPPGGITLLGYVVRRMHKTALLLPASEMLKAGHTHAQRHLSIARSHG